MQNTRLATRYAKSLLDLAIEQNIIKEVFADIQLLKGLMKTNADFVALLRSPIIKADKKDSIIEKVLADKMSNLSFLFIKLLTNKGRENNLPEIVTAFIDQYNQLNNIQIVKLTTATPISEAIKESIVGKVKGNTNTTVQIETAVKEELIGGFTLEVGGTLIDASIRRDLNDVKKQFLNNEYVHNIR